MMTGAQLVATFIGIATMIVVAFGLFAWRTIVYIDSDNAPFFPRWKRKQGP